MKNDTLIQSVKITDPRDVWQTFLELTKTTCPEGYEFIYHDALTELGFSQDTHGNYWAHVGTAKEQRIMFAAHLDTVGGNQIHPVNHVLLQEGRVVGTDGSSILGADDKAGVAILLYLLHYKVPGTYALFMGEEQGCIGSSAVAGETTLRQWDAVVSFDRAGYRDIITHQAGTRTASDAFAEALAAQINAVFPAEFQYAKCDGGVYTDSNEFAQLVPECTNISVGYFKQHSVSETQDLVWLECLAHACSLVRWSELPIERDPTVFESLWGYGHGGRYDDDYYGYSVGKSYKSTRKIDRKLNRVLGESDIVPYMEAKYGTLMVAWKMTELIEYMDKLTTEQVCQWIVANKNKVAVFIDMINATVPELTEETAEYVDAVEDY